MERSKPSIAALGLIAALLPAACVDPGEPPPAPVGEAAAELTTADTCPGTQYVGRASPAPSCPTEGMGSGWSAERLFSVTAPAPLNEYCLYTWTVPDTDPLPGTLPSYAGKPPTEWLDADCMVVAPLGDASDAVEEVRPRLMQRWLEQLETPPSLPAPISAADVHVAIVDSWSHVGIVGNSDHGFAMGAIVDRLTCRAVNPGNCYLTLSPHLALNIEEPGVVNNQQGGHFGWQSRLARSIYDAVTTWQATNSEAKLVVNLSVGFDEDFAFDGAVLREPVRAVKAALELVACAGGIAIASAGNTTGGPSPSEGPVYPAAWEQLPAPACLGVPATRPLLWSVGGVDGRDFPLANVREGARPTLAAPSFAVPARMDVGGAMTTVTPKTGSSVSAAVVSAIAATVWHLDGNLKPAQVMEIIKSTGEEAPLKYADFCFGTSCSKIRRVSLCRAVEDTTGAVLGCPQILWGGGSNPRWTPASVATIESWALKTFDGANLAKTATVAGCSSYVKIPTGFLSTPGPYPCPFDQFTNEVLAPGVAPQPGTNPCPACAYRIDATGATVELVINERLDVSLVFPQTLALSNRAGTLERFDIARAEYVDPITGAVSCLGDGVVPGGIYKVALPLPSGDYGTDFDYATIEWVNLPDVQTTSELVVWEE